VLHGPVGTGKTHLLEGLYAALRRQQPGWRVVFVTAEEFTNRFVQAMRLGKLGAFRHHFRECDALLVDDVQFLASKPATQEEFLHTFDALHADGRQVVVTADCHPRLGGELTPLLTDRLAGGACWSLMPPDTATRAEVLRRKAGVGGLPDELIDFLAGRLRGNVRELEGALNTLRHYSHVTGRPMDLALAREALGELLRHAVTVVQLPDVDRAVCAALKLPAGALQARQRAWAVSHPRMLAMYLARKHTAAAYSEIGRYFGGRNHSTAVAAEKKVRQWLSEDGSITLEERTVRVRDVLELAERELLR
jgi:chromosomal replication initiator protein